MEWTKGKKAAAVIAGIAVISIICGIVYYGVMRSKYNKVVEMIKQGNYETAEEMLIDMNVKDKDDDLDRNFFKVCAVDLYEYPYMENIEHYFSDSAILYIYISAMEYYKDNKFEFANDRINLVPEDYRGALCEEIKTSKQEINKRYEEYQQEVEKAKQEYLDTYQERMEKEEQEKKQKLEEERRSYADKMPYEGMNESYIDCTQLGTPDKYKRTKLDDVHDEEVYDFLDVFVWYDNGYYIVCQNGTVNYVKQFSTDFLREYCEETKMKDFDPDIIKTNLYSKESRKKEKNSSSSSSHSSSLPRLYGYSHGDSNHRSDKYNVYDYDDPEDFYYDNEDDFDGIEDAETYFYDHND